jgi:hypothetical protein
VGNFAILWQEHRLRVFENRVVRGMLGRRMDEILGSWKKTA